MHFFGKKKLNSRSLFHLQYKGYSGKNDSAKINFGELGKEIRLLLEDNRNNFISEKIISSKLQELIDHNKCKNCWLLSRYCTCIADNNKIETEMKNEFLFYMHPKEFGRGSNTAVIVLDCFPRNSKILIAGIKKDEDQLRLKIEEQKGNIFVLTPSPKSLFFHELKQKSDIAIPQNQKFTFIVLDGTWDQTKRLAKSDLLKDIPHLKLGCAGGTMSTLRKQSNYGRVTTAEAVMLLLEEMGFEKEVAYLHKNIEAKIFRAQIQRGNLDKSLPRVNPKE